MPRSKCGLEFVEFFETCPRGATLQRVNRGSRASSQRDERLHLAGRTTFKKRMNSTVDRLTISFAVLLSAAPFSQSGEPKDPRENMTLDSADSGEKPLTIKDVMRFTMTQGLCQKVIKNKADDAEKKRLVELFEKMAELSPPAGDAAAWKAKSAALIVASKAIADGKSAHANLAKAANCTACHKDHRPKP